MLARTVGKLSASVGKSATGYERVATGGWASCIVPYYLLRTHPWSIIARERAQLVLQKRCASSSSSTRWKNRQGRDSYAREARVAGLKSRAAFKLLEINEKYKLFRKRDTVVDLGFAPGSWSQVAVNRTSPGGRVVGIDVIPAQPPRGANALQGNFLSAEIREEVRKFVSDPDRGRVRSRTIVEHDVTEEDLQEEARDIVELEKHAAQDQKTLKDVPKEDMTQKQLDLAEGRVVNVVLSDMLMNTSGIAARDHGGSMDLCMAALTFCFDTLATGGNFICKFYTGAEDHAMELRLKKLFDKVHRIKPDSTRKESKEAYFVGLRRKAGAVRADVLEDG